MVIERRAQQALARIERRDRARIAEAISGQHAAGRRAADVVERTRSDIATELRFTRVPPGQDGRVDPAAIAEALRADTLLVSVMHTNNEAGVMQPLREIAAVAAGLGVLLHVDAARAAGKPFVTVALAEKLSTPRTEGLIEYRASRADRDRCRVILSKVSNTPAVPGHGLPQD